MTFIWFAVVVWIPIQMVYYIHRFRGGRPAVKSLVLGTLAGIMLVGIFLEPTTYYLFHSVPVGIGQELGYDVESPWFTAFIRAGLYEELLKLVLLSLLVGWQRQVTWGGRRPSRTLLWDTLIPALWIHSGFAIVENTFYAADALANAPEHLYLVALIRSFIPATAHLSLGVIMGFLYHLAETATWQRPFFLLLALTVPALVHGGYDWFAFTSPYGWAVLPFLAAMTVVAYLLLRLARREEQRAIAAIAQ